MGSILHDVRVIGVVLAAGRSVRMGRPKALLDLGGRSFLEVVLAAMHRAGVKSRVVVAGPNSQAFQGFVPEDVRLVAEGTGPEPIDSIRAAMAVADWAEAMLVWPVDHPHVEPDTARALLAAYGRERAPIVAPSFSGHRGHPMIWGRETWEALRSDPATEREGARAIARRIPVLHVDVDDEAVIEDIDTPAAYARLVKRWGGQPE
jgi:molybdenum cofactor cytidylyltransferase